MTKKISILLHCKHTEKPCKNQEWRCSSKMWLSNSSCFTWVPPQPPSGTGEMAVWASLYGPMCSCSKNGFWIQSFELWFTCRFGQQEDWPHWGLETTPVNWSNIWAQYQAEAQIQQSMFRDVRTHVIPRSDQGSLCTSRCCWGSPRQELIHFSHGEPGRELPLNHRECGHARIPLTYQTSQAAALVRTEVFVCLPHQRLLACSVAAESGGCFLLFRSEFGLWSAGNQTPGSNAYLCSTLLQQTCKGVLLV